MTKEVPETVHGTCVAIDEKAVLLIGGSGSGKSALALTLISLGAVLVSDDQVIVEKVDRDLFASCPKGYEGMIEARGIGILNVPFVAKAEITLCVDLDQTELQRLPPSRKYEMLGSSIEMLFGRNNWHLASGILAMLKGGRHS